MNLVFPAKVTWLLLDIYTAPQIYLAVLLARVVVPPSFNAVFLKNMPPPAPAIELMLQSIMIEQLKE